MSEKLLQTDQEDTNDSQDGDSDGQSSADSHIGYLNHSVLLRHVSGDASEDDGNTRFNLVQLQDSNMMSLLSCWHSIVLWLTACIMLCEVLQKLLKGFVLWMEAVMTSQIWDHESHYIQYAAVLVRSWFAVLCYADLSRFCFWLMRDSWRPDNFEAYRRALCGLSKQEIESGILYIDSAGMPAGWPVGGVSKIQRIIDCAVQIIIFVSLDIYPLVGTLWENYQGQVFPGSLEGLLSSVMVKAGMAGFVHVLCFKAAWTIMDARLKIRHLKAILNTDWPESDSESESETAAPAVQKRSLTAVIDSEIMDEVRARIQVSTEMNLCLRLCDCWTMVTPHMLWITILAAGIGLSSWRICLFAMPFMIYNVGILFVMRCDRKGTLPTARGLHKKHHEPFLFAMQRWGEEDLGLDQITQGRRRWNFVAMVALQAVLFIFLNTSSDGSNTWRPYATLCLAFLCLQLVHLTVRCQMPYGWLVGLGEAAVTFIFASTICWWLPTIKQALETILFVIAHQFGLPRRTYYGMHGYKVVRIVLVILFLAMTIVVAATAVAVSPTLDEGSASAASGSVLYNVSNFYEVPWVPAKKATNMDCPSWFSLGNRGNKLSLIDFGLMSMISYEPKETINSTLEHFLPGWTNAYEKRFDPGSISAKSRRERQWITQDWTTFFEFTKGDTSVFVVRGTASPLDALNDMVIWMPAALMQGFNLLGPDMLPKVVTAIQWLSSFLGKLDNSNFGELERYVMQRLQEDNDREFYITGHSLGGGLAKLVGMKALTKGKELPAITFMSPGIQATQYLIEADLSKEIERSKQGSNVSSDIKKSEDSVQYLRLHGSFVTVMPTNDIVSRIDSQTGQVVPIACSYPSPIQCHLIGTGLCTMMTDCGSGKEDRSSVKWPCGICPDMPCIAANNDTMNYKPLPSAWKKARHSLRNQNHR